MKSFWDLIWAKITWASKLSTMPISMFQVYEIVWKIGIKKIDYMQNIHEFFFWNRTSLQAFSWVSHCNWKHFYEKNFIFVAWEIANFEKLVCQSLLFIGSKLIILNVCMIKISEIMSSRFEAHKTLRGDQIVFIGF